MAEVPQSPLARIEWSRRKFLGMSALGAVGLSACAGQPAAPQVQVEVPPDVVAAAARFRGSSMGMLSQRLFSEAGNAALDRSVQAFAQATGTTIQNDLVQADTGDMVARTDAAVKAGNARDLAFFTDSRFVAQFHNLGDLTDVTDVVEELRAELGQPTAESQNYCVFGGRWFAIPYHFIGISGFLRRDWAEERGIPLQDAYPWEELRDIALEISDPSRRRFGWGQTVNRSGDGNGFIENVINTYGGAIASNDGRTVVFNSPETVEAVAFLGDLYTNPRYAPMRPPGLESWTDASNNENWLAGVLGMTRNQHSVYADSKRTNNPVYANTHAFIDGIGPAAPRPIAFGQSQAFVIFQGARNPDLAKQVAKYLVSGTPLLGIAREAPGLVNPAWERVWDSDPYYTTGDPAFSAIRAIAHQPLPLMTSTGYAFPQTPSPGQQASVSAYVLTDMMQEVIQGARAADAVATAHQRMVQIFEQQGLRQ